jgi:hypothetical protein
MWLGMMLRRMGLSFLHAAVANVVSWDLVGWYPTGSVD